MKVRFLLPMLAWPLLAVEAPLPLPEAPIRLLVPDAKAFDALLTGGYRRAFTGKPKAGDPLPAGWRQSQVGSKLENQWLKFSADLPLTWDEIKKLNPTSLGLAILQIGHLEAVLVVETPLAALPASYPAGTRKVHGGVAYSLVASGAADGSEDPDRRMGLAWSRMGGRLILATSERALKLAIDQAQAGRGFASPMEGIVGMELDLEALRRDRYFRREFVFPEGPETGRVRAALRLESGRLVEVREGTGEARSAVYTFESPASAASGWEPAGSEFWTAFRRGLLEPLPVLSDKPVLAVASLPPATAAGTEDRYAVNFTRPVAAPGAPAWEEGDLAPWKALLARNPVASWGYLLGRDGARRMVFPWPAASDAEFLEHCRATVARRGGRATVSKEGDVTEIRVGPGLPALALRRAGACLWVAPSAKDLRDAPMPRLEAALIRWARVDLAAVRAEGPRWAKVEGPPRPEAVRPLSDRVMGLLGWMPATTFLSVERRKTAGGWTERVVFGGPGK